MTGSNKISKRILLGIVLALLIFFVNNLMISYRISDIETTVNLITQNTEQALNTPKQIVELISISDSISDTSAKTTKDFLNNIVNSKPEMWSHFLIADQTGKVLLTTSEYNLDKLISSKEYFLQATAYKKTAISQPCFSEVTGKAAIPIATPIFNENDKISGVFVGFLKPEYISQSVTCSISKDSVSFISDVNGDITILAGNSHTQDTNLKDFFNEKDISRILTSPDGSFVKTIHNRLNYLMHTKVDETPFSLVSAIPLHQAFYNVIIIDLIIAGSVIILLILLIITGKLEKSKKHAVSMELRAETDPLTGLKNRQWLDNLDITTFCEAYYTVLFFDVDNFKEFNDYNNHNYGDDILRHIGTSLAKCTRPESDVGVRYAGDEFLVFFKDTNIEAANIVAMRLMKLLSEYKNINGETEPITVSCGISRGIAAKNNLTDVISKADDAVYKAKANGKNCIVIS